MNRQYYSSRNRVKSLNLDQLFLKVGHAFSYFRNLDYFKGELDITERDIPINARHKAAFSINFEPFIAENTNSADVTESDIFDFLEFLHDHISEPGDWGTVVTDSNFNYEDYRAYDSKAGQSKFRKEVNRFLCDYRDGYELAEVGEILASGGGLVQILQAEIVPYDEENVDSKVRDAIKKWRNRHLDLGERKAAIRELADVFEWLKKTKQLETVLSNRDESALFEIVNNFHIRHHNPKQKSNYDENIWYAWMFHFYLATYHAAIRLLLKAG